MTDGPQPPDFDPELWITAHHYDGRLYLLGNAHTHPGRMVAWSEALATATFVSKYDVTDASDASHRWIEGFLRGNEPSPAEYLGIDVLAEADLDSDDPAYARWAAGLDEFRRMGTMLPLARVPTIPLADDAAFSHVPWTWAGGQVWIWNDHAWIVADPQPTLVGGLLEGTTCAGRGYHEMDGSDDRHQWCVECGETAEIPG